MVTPNNTPTRPTLEQALVFTDRLVNFIAEHKLLDKLSDDMKPAEAVLAFAESNYVIDGWTEEERLADYEKAGIDSVRAVYGQEPLDLS